MVNVMVRSYVYHTGSNTNHTYYTCSELPGTVPKYGGTRYTHSTTGAVHPDTVGMLYAWHNEARSEGHADRTVYGKARTATRSFYLCAPSASHLASSGHRCRAAGSAVGQGGQK